MGIRVQDLLDPKIFHEKIAAALAGKVELLERVYGQDVSGLEAECDEYLQMAGTLRPYIADTSLLVWQAVRDGKRVLLEGAQGTLLDIDHGTYPFVTSSNPVAGAACVGSGIGPTQIDDVWGICKAYQTRVGEGPFPTELTDATGRYLRDVGHEYGATTGRERRCGWLDLVALRYAVRLNGMTGLVDHQDRRAERPRRDQGVHGLPVPGRSADRDAAQPVGLPPRRAGLRDVPRAGRPTSVTCATSATFRRRPATTCRSSPRAPACRP